MKRREDEGSLATTLALAILFLAICGLLAASAIASTTKTRHSVDAMVVNEQDSTSRDYALAAVRDKIQKSVSLTEGKVGITDPAQLTEPLGATDKTMVNGRRVVWKAEGCRTLQIPQPVVDSTTKISVSLSPATGIIKETHQLQTNSYTYRSVDTTTGATCKLRYGYDDNNSGQLDTGDKEYTALPLLGAIVDSAELAKGIKKDPVGTVTSKQKTTLAVYSIMQKVNSDGTTYNEKVLVAPATIATYYSLNWNAMVPVWFINY